MGDHRLTRRATNIFCAQDPFALGTDAMLSPAAAHQIETPTRRPARAQGREDTDETDGRRRVPRDVTT
eukprot:6190578-Pleurochrysis_carterae.AAC.2